MEIGINKYGSCLQKNDIYMLFYDYYKVVIAHYDRRYMAIKIEFVNLIIPIEKINRSNFEGGFDAVIKKYEHLIGHAIWFDKYLFRMGWMDTWMIDSEIDFWKNNGLLPFENLNGVEYWKDLFAISSGVNQFMANCEWIQIDMKKNTVWLKGTDPNEIYPNREFASFNISN